MAITVRAAPERSRFEILLDEDVVGFAVYHVEDGRAAIPHTEIRPDLSGRGLGTALVGQVLDAARADGHLVLPYCSFVSSFIRDNPEYLDLVPVDERDSFGCERVPE